MIRVFVSYRREDSAYVAATIRDKLEQRFGQNSVFFDIDTIPLGIDFRRHISDAVGKCDILIAIIGDTWCSIVDDQEHRRLDEPTDYVRVEIEAALARDIPIIPVLVGKARMPVINDLPSSLQDIVFRNAAEVRPGHDLQQHLTRLITGIEKTLEALHPRQEVEELPKAVRNEGSAAADGESSTPSFEAQESSLSAPFQMRWLLMPIIIIVTIASTFAVFMAAQNPVPGLMVLVVGIMLAYQLYKRS